MITLSDMPVVLRIEVRKNTNFTSIVVVDPINLEEFEFASQLDRLSITETNRYIWNALEKLTDRIAADPSLSEHAALLHAYEIYGVGQAALQRLAGRASTLRLPELKRFSAVRVDPSRATTQIIQIVADPEDYLPFEILPLLGDVGDPRAPDAESLVDLQRAVPGLAAICVHDSEVLEAGFDVSRRLPIRLFQHAGLPGVARERRAFERLRRRRRLLVCEPFPPKGFKPGQRPWEPDLIREVVKKYPTSRSSVRADEGMVPVAHFSCHIRQEAVTATLVLRPEGWFKTDSIEYALDQIEMEAGRNEKGPPPLIFLGACASATQNQKTYNSAVTAFEWLHPRSIVGALASIPDLLTSEFTSLFYDQASNGVTVGSAMLEARLAAIKEFRNPFCLLFVSFFGEGHVLADPRATWDRFIPPPVELA